MMVKYSNKTLKSSYYIDRKWRFFLFKVNNWLGHTKNYSSSVSKNDDIVQKKIGYIERKIFM